MALRRAWPPIVRSRHDPRKAAAGGNHRRARLAPNCSDAGLLAPPMQLIGVHIVPARHRGDARLA